MQTKRKRNNFLIVEDVRIVLNVLPRFSGNIYFQ